MVLIKNLFLFVLFLVTTSLCQAMQEPINPSNAESTRWPILERFKAMKDPELDRWYSDLADQTEMTSLPRVQEEIARFPLVAEGSYIEILLESLRLAQKAGTEEADEKIKVKQVLEFYQQGFREAYYKRFPGEDQTNFDVIMNPFLIYINSLSPVKWNDLKEEESNDIFEKAWGLLKQVLKTV